MTKTRQLIAVMGMLLIATITTIFLVGCRNNQYVAFMVGTTEHASVRIVDDQVTLPTQPTRSNYSFDGWFTDNNTFVNRFNHESVGEVRRVYARFILTVPEPEEIEIPITIIIDGEDYEHYLTIYSDVLNITLEDILKELDITVEPEQYRKIQWYFNDEAVQLEDSFTITQLEEGAIFEVIQHQVSRQIIIDANEGTFDGDEIIRTFWGNEVSYYITLTDLTEDVSRDNHELLHWVVIQGDDEVTLTQEILDTLIMPNEDITIKAQWQIDTFTVTIELNDDDVTNANANQMYIEDVAFGTNLAALLLAQIEVTSGSHYFGSWDKPSPTVTDDITVTVIWGDARTFRVTIDLNNDGILNATASKVYIEDVAFGTNLADLLAEITVTSHSHRFGSWYMPPATVTQNITVMVIWGEARLYTVTIDLNNDGILNATASKMYIEDVAFGTNLAELLAEITVTSHSHRFGSWYMPPATVTQNITVMVIWGEARVYTVTVYLNDDEVTNATATPMYIENVLYGTNVADLLSQIDVTSASHYFGSWNKPSAIVTENMTLTVMWGDVRRFVVTIDLNDAAVSGALASSAYIENVLYGTNLAVLLAPITVTSNSHIFGSWDITLAQIVTQDMAVRVIWGHQIGFTITINLNDEDVTGATATPALSFGAPYGTPVSMLLSSITVTSASHYFYSWDIPSPYVTDNMTMTVIWGALREFTVTIDLNAEGVTEAYASQLTFTNVTFGTSLADLLSEITVGSVTHTFLSWDVPLTTTVTEDMTIMVKWQENIPANYYVHTNNSKFLWSFESII